MGKQMMREGGKTDNIGMTLYSKYFISNSITNCKICGLTLPFFFFLNHQSLSSYREQIHPFGKALMKKAGN